MSIQSPSVGVLDIKNATLRVGKLEVASVQGIDASLNTFKANSILLFDDQRTGTTNPFTLSGSAQRHSTTLESTSNIILSSGSVYAGLGLPNAWSLEFDLYAPASGSTGNVDVQFYSTSSTGGGGYKVLFDMDSDPNEITLSYDGTSLKNVTPTVEVDNTWQKVVILYERGVISMSLNDVPVLYHKDIERSGPYTIGTGGFVVFTCNGAADRRIRNVKISNDGPWSFANQSNIAYLNGSVGIGTNAPSEKLEVIGTTKATLFSGSGASLTNIPQSGVVNLTDNVQRISTLETDLGSNSTRISTIESGVTTLSGNKTFQDDVVISGNLTVAGTTTVVDTENLSIKDPIIELARDSINGGDTGIILRRASGTSNVAMFYDESADVLKMGYTLSGASDTTIELDSNALTVNVQGDLLAADATFDNLSVAADTDYAASIGRVRIGQLKATDQGGLSHYDLTGSTEYAIAQNGAGRTFVNAKSGQGLYFLEENSTKMRLIDGKLGIGTDSPSVSLHVKGEAMIGTSADNYQTELKSLYFIRGLTRNTGGTGDRHHYISTVTDNVAGNNKMLFYIDDATTTNGTSHVNALTLTGSGNVGIGTDSPSAPLHVQGARSILGNNGGASDIIINDIPQARWKIGTGGYALNFSKHNSASDEYSTWSEKVRIDQNGNVGIGTTNLNSLLTFYRDYTVPSNGSEPVADTVQGITFRSDLNSYAGSPAPTWSNSTNPVDVAKIWFQPRSYNGISSSAGVHGYLAFGTGYFGSQSSTPDMVINTSGNVGIGITNPSAKLHVQGDLYVSSPKIQNLFYAPANWGYTDSSNYETNMWSFTYNAPADGYLILNVNAHYNYPYANQSFYAWISVDNKTNDDSALYDSTTVGASGGDGGHFQEYNDTDVSWKDMNHSTSAYVSAGDHTISLRFQKFTNTYSLSINGGAIKLLFIPKNYM